MAIDPRKRQKKLEKRKAKQMTERRELARRNAGGLPARIRQASTAPVLHCCASAELWKGGIGEVLISRQLKNGDVAFVAFLVDLYCLGVKNLIMNVAPRPLYERNLYDKLAAQYELIPLRPECARKLVEGAVQYALDLGLPPYHDYRTAKLIFGDIQAEACIENFEYGKDGKPFFIAGPHDHAARCRDIIQTLHDSCGPNGYHFLMSNGPMPEVLEEDDDEDAGT
jgi:hypothetical protein